MGHDFRISGAGANTFERHSAVTWSTAGNEYLVVWQDGHNSSTRGDDIYGRRVAE